MRKIVILVTHLLGSGHLVRAAALARAAAAEGRPTLLISGGRPSPHLPLSGSAPRLETLQLPPLASDGVNFRRLLAEDGAPADAAYLAARRAALAEALSEPIAALVTELFPFGRRQLADEFEAALALASAQTPRPLILSSVRDILAPPSKPSRADEAEARLARWYDGVLVHSDPSAAPLEASWPVSPALAAKLHYTGFVGPAGPSAAAAPPEALAAAQDEALVAAGGGPVGEALFQAAIDAAAAGGGRPAVKRWRLLVGGGGAAQTARIASLQTRAAALGAPVIVESARADYRSLLGAAALSVSQAGYNTAIDLLGVTTPSVLAPFAEGGEVEQTLRAERLAAAQPFQIVPEHALSGPALSAAATRALAAGPRSSGGWRLDGAADAARRIEAMAAARIGAHS